MSLYSDKTFDAIQTELLSMFEEGISELPESQRVDASEGSLIYLATSIFARRLEDVYGDLDAINDNMLVDTQDFDHLTDSGVECGVPLEEGTNAVVTVDLNVVCEIGDEFSAIDSDYNYIAIEYVGTIDDDTYGTLYRYYMESDEEGVDPGSYRGEVEPEDYLDGFEYGVVIATYTAGTDTEEEEVYRERRLNSYTSRGCAGNREWYIDTIGDLDGVGGVKVERRSDVVIPVYIMSDEYGVPDDDVLDDIKETMDPETYEGEGMGLAPIGHVLDINAVEGVDINVTATFTFDEDYSFSILETALTTAVTDYLTELSETWQDSSSIVVRIAYIESALLGVTGVLDIDDVTINGDTENVTCTEYQIPVMGTLAENE